MKLVGVVLIAIGFALMLFVFYNFLQQENRLRTPIPEEKGVKVIFITPAK